MSSYRKGKSGMGSLHPANQDRQERESDYSYSTSYREQDEQPLQSSDYEDEDVFLMEDSITPRTIISRAIPSITSSSAPSYTVSTASRNLRTRAEHPVRRGSDQPQTSVREQTSDRNPSTTSTLPTNDPRTSSADAIEPDEPIALSQAAFAFIGIKCLDFKKCAATVDKLPNVLDTKQGLLQTAAIRAFASHQNDLGERITERLLIIKRCESKNTDEAVSYIRSLAKRTLESDDFVADYRKLIKAFELRASAQQPRQSSSTDSEASDTTITQGVSRVDLRGPAPARTSQMYSHAEPSTARPSTVTRHHSGSHSQTASAPSYETSGRGNVMNKLALQDTALTASRRATTTTDAQYLHKEYQVQESPTSFFEVGRVFKALWHQPAGSDLDGRVRGEYHIGKFEEPIFSTLRWMVVVSKREGYCICCPITTYGRTGLSIKNVPSTEIQSHAVVYNSAAQPVMYRGEPKLSKYPIPIVVDHTGTVVHGSSRVHFGKHHTVEYNVKVLGIGKVDREYLDLLRQYAQAEFYA